MNESYRLLAQKLDEHPNGFPAVDDESDLRLLAKLFSPEEAGLASHLRIEVETAAEVAERAGGDPVEVSRTLKNLARRGLITCRKTEKGLGFALMPFVVGFYENQNGNMDVELAQLFENYYRKAADRLLAIHPQVHRIMPVNESIRNDMEIKPYESAASILDRAQAWGVIDCICRKQKALIGEACRHPIDVCMVLSPVPASFDHDSMVRALSKEEAQQTLKRAAEAGLVHSVNNSQETIWYICNCCTCSCGILRGIKEMGLSNVVARSAFVNFVNDELCIGCESCVSACQFDAITYATTARIDPNHCVGCGVCVVACPEGALSLIRRPENEVEIPPVDEQSWRVERIKEKG
jgi:Na+-translocating ferredoxin:NAD+ oxidoreductase subunit B